MPKAEEWTRGKEQSQLHMPQPYVSLHSSFSFCPNFVLRGKRTSHIQTSDTMFVSFNGIILYSRPFFISLCKMIYYSVIFYYFLIGKFYILIKKNNLLFYLIK